MREVVRETRKFSPEEKRVQRIQESLETNERAVQAAAAAGVPQAQLQRMEAATAGQIDQIDAVLAVEVANAKTVIRRTTTLDLPGRRVRRDDEDLRDLETLAREHSLDQWQRMSLTRTQSIIANGDKPQIVLHPHVNRLATILPSRRLQPQHELRNLGVIPAWVFEGNYELEYRAPGDAKEVQIVGREPGAGPSTIVVNVAPDLAFAMTGYTIYKDDKVVEEWGASDFRAVSGVFIPFKTRHALSYSRPGEYIAEREVEQVRINEPLPDGDATFAIPKDYRVSDLSQNPKP